MPQRSRRPLAAAIALSSLALLLAWGHVHAQDAPAYKVGNLIISAPWSRETPNAARVAAGYLRITNAGPQSDRLIGGSVPFAARVEVHEMTMADGVMRMRELASGLDIKPGETVELKPGGLHLMFMDLKSSLKAGVAYKAQLQFQRAGAVEIEFQVTSAAAPAAGSAHKH